MKFDAFIGGSYQGASFSADQEHTVNWYTEIVPTSGATSNKIFLPVPGVEPVGVMYGGAGRGHLFLDDREFAVTGDTLYEFDKDGGRTSGGVWGVSDQATSPVTISSNGDLGGQLLVVEENNAAYYDTTAALTPVNIAALTGKCTMGAYLDGYGLVLDSATSTLYTSALGDFSSFSTGTDFAQRSLAPDPWRAMKVAGRYVWMLGEQTSEIWQDVGARFPLAPIPNALLDWGIRAQYSSIAIGSELFWLGQNASGRTSILRARGQGIEIISTPALEYEINGYTNVEGAVGDTYSWNGHSFYLLHFDTDNVTWCWDLTTGDWHQRGTWDEELGQFLSWRPRYFVNAYGEARALDSLVGTPTEDLDEATTASFLYRLTDDFIADVDGRPMRRVRRAPAIVDEDRRLFHRDLQIHMDSGTGPNPENFATVSESAQTADITETTLFTVGGADKSFVVTWALLATTTTADFALSGQIQWYLDGTQYTYYSGSIREDTPPGLSGTISIRADANTAVSYLVNYTSTVGTMAYSVDISVDTPGTENPQAMLRWSDDGGKTWSNEHWRAAGKVGQYGKRTRWERLGASRRRVYELVTSDSIPWRVTSAYLGLEREAT